MKHHAIANQIIIETRQRIAWQQDPDEALQEGINVVLTDASDDAKADLFARICEAEDFELTTVQKLVEKHLA